MSNTQSPHSAPRRIIVKNSDDLWLDDRDVVLFTVRRPEDSTDEVHVMYGLRKSILGLSSEFLDSTFSGLQDAFLVASETYEGLPTMRFYDDAADVDAFLHAVYIPGYLHQLVEEHKDPKHGLLTPPPTYPGILRIAQKLIAPERVIRAVSSVFEECWSSDVKKWKSKERVFSGNAYRELFVPPDQEDEEEHWDITEHYPDTVATYALARKHPALSNILPTVGYDIVHSQAELDPYRQFPFRRLDLTRLDEQDALSVQTGKEAYRRDGENAFNFDSFIEHGLFVSHCKRTKPRASTAQDLVCFPGLEAFWECKVAPLLAPNRSIDFMRFPIACKEDTICEACSAGVLRHLQNAQHYVWAKLPVYFGVVDRVTPYWGLNPAIHTTQWQNLPFTWKVELTTIWDTQKARKMVEDRDHEQWA